MAMEKPDWFAAIVAVLALGGGLYLSTYRKGLIRGSGLALMALGSAALVFWFGYYRDIADAQQPPVINNQGGIFAPNQSNSQNTINNFGPPQRDLQSPQFADLRERLKNLPKDVRWQLAVEQVGGIEAMNFGNQIQNYLLSTGHSGPVATLLLVTIASKGVEILPMRDTLQVQVGLPE